MLTGHHRGLASRALRPTRPGGHPFRKSWPSCASATRSLSSEREVTLDDIEHFADFTGDTFYAHMDEDAAAANPFFPGRVAHGYLLVSWAAGLFVDPDARARARELRAREPAVRHAGLARRQHPRER